MSFKTLAVLCCLPVAISCNRLADTPAAVLNTVGNPYLPL